MNRRTSLVLLAGAFALAPSFALAADAPSAAPSAAEAAFVGRISADLGKRFPTTADAVRAGFVRFTDEDEDGAISYANREWTSADSAHPSQLWYDAHGRLIGADYSVRYDATNRPKLFGVDPARWQAFEQAHVHYVLAGPGGEMKYGGIGHKKIIAAGGNVDHPTPDALVAAGIAKNASDVRLVFTFPAIWDLPVWVIPNSAGAFAEKNPDMTPVHPKGSM